MFNIFDMMRLKNSPRNSEEYHPEVKVKEISTQISLAELLEMAAPNYENFVKAVADVAQRLLVVDMDLHADGEQYLLENGSKQGDLWGFNIYPGSYGADEFLEFDSMINIRPQQNNRSRNISDEKIRAQIASIVKEKIYE
jgi:hypothetical protein